MKGLKIDLSSPEGPRLDPYTVVDGFDATVQNAMLLVGTSQGSNRIFPDQGTNLLKRSISGVMIDNKAAEHECNFAATDVLFFGRPFDSADESVRLQLVKLSPLSLAGQRLTVQAQFTATDSTVVGAIRSI